MLHRTEWFHLMLATRPARRSPITMDQTLTAAPALAAADRLPAVEAFPLYGGDALPQNPGTTVQRIEIVSSVEKADGRHPENRWLVDVAERFNQRRERIGGGPPIEVVVRAIPSGLGTQMLAAGKMRPAGYSPAGQSWLELLRHQGLPPTLISDKLVANTTVIALRQCAWRWLNQGPASKINFAQVVDQILAGKLKLGYSNPYTSSAGLDFLQTLLWVLAGHRQDRKPLTAAELSRPQITKLFDLLQQRIAGTAPTYPQSIQMWKSQPSRFDAVVMAHQSFNQLKQQPGFEDLVEVPFGTPQNSPLAAFPWTTALERQALQRFAQFASSEPMQALAQQRGYGEPQGIAAAAKPPQADGALLSKAQTLWKQPMANEPLLHGGAWRLLDHPAGSGLALELTGANPPTALAGESQLLQRTAAAPSDRSLSLIVDQRSALPAAALSRD
jgi:Ca-activated chloride channel family protein